MSSDASTQVNSPDLYFSPVSHPPSPKARNLGIALFLVYLDLRCVNTQVAQVSTSLLVQLEHSDEQTPSTLKSSRSQLR